MTDRFASLKLQYPDAPTSDDADTLHGVRVADPYRWLENIDDQNTRRWVEAESRLADEFLATIPAREPWHARLTELWDYEKYGVPIKRGGRYFFSYNDGLQNQNVLCWQEALDGERRVLLDPNTLSDDGTVALTGWQVSDDGRLLAYGLSGAGSDWQTWHVREVDSGQDRPDRLEWVKFTGAAWLPGGDGLFYSRYDAPPQGLAYKGANYNQKLFLHRLGQTQEQDELVYQRPDQPEWGFSAQISEDHRYLVVTVWHGTHQENGIVYRELDDPDAPMHELLLDWDAGYDFAGNDGRRFFFATDLDAPRGRIIAIDTGEPGRDHWVELVAESDDTLQGARLAGGRFVASYLHDAHSRLAVFDTNGTPLEPVQLPGIGSIAGFSGRAGDDEAFVLYTSFYTPATVYRYDLAHNELAVLWAPRVLFDPQAFQTEQVFVPSADGTRVPMFLSYRRGLEHSADTPTLLYGYGGFNVSLTPAFSVANLVWMEGGGIYAQANLRGGGEYGKAWHQAGTKLQKQNVFDDFIACAEWLIEHGYTSTSKLAISGGSNGGLLVGACLTQRPELFGAAVAAVGVLDMLRFHTWTIGWAWVSDYGSPDDKAEFEALLRYSPYHNVKPGTRYPPLLITTGDHDDRVFPAHSFKFAAAMQAAQAGDAPVLLRVDMRAGHGMGKPTAKLIAERADIGAFLTWALGIEKFDPRMSANGRE